MIQTPAISILVSTSEQQTASDLIEIQVATQVTWSGSHVDDLNCSGYFIKSPNFGIWQ